MSKWRNRIVKTEDGTFHSRKEYRRWCDLKILERTGRIQELRRQVPYTIEVNGKRICKYIADFVYLENGQEVVEDVKGKPTPEYRLKAKLMLAVHGIKLLET